MTGTIYANSIADYLGGKLLDAEKLRRLSDAADLSVAVKMLTEFGYGGGQLSAQSYDVDRFINEQIKLLAGFIAETAANGWLGQCLTNRFAYSDAKVIYKSRFTAAVDTDAALYGADQIVQDALGGGRYDGLPEPMKEAAAALDARREAGQTPDAKEIDLAFTRAMHKDNLFCAQKSKSKSLTDYCRAQIDITNILTAYRAKRLGMSAEELSAELFDGGVIPAAKYADILTAAPKVFLEHFEKTNYYDLAAELNDGGDVAQYLKKTDGLLLELLRGKSESVTGNGPFIRYYIEQILEFKAVKFILVCVKNGLKKELNERLSAYLP